MSFELVKQKQNKNGPEFGYHTILIPLTTP